MSEKRQHFLLSYLKTLSAGPSEVWTSDLPHGSSSTLPTLYLGLQLVPNLAILPDVQKYFRRREVTTGKYVCVRRLPDVQQSDINLVCLGDWKCSGLSWTLSFLVELALSTEQLAIFLIGNKCILFEN